MRVRIVAWLRNLIREELKIAMLPMHTSYQQIANAIEILQTHVTSLDGTVFGDGTEVGMKAAITELHEQMNHAKLQRDKMLQFLRGARWMLGLLLALGVLKIQAVSDIVDQIIQLFG